MPLGIGIGVGISVGEGVGGISTIGADLALWFDTNQAYKSSGGGVVTPASILTVVRASAGSYFDSAGILQQASNGTLRLDYNPTTLAPLGVLVEEQRTNLLLRSQEFDNASFSKSGLTVTANQIAAPDGTTTADLMTAAATNACRAQQAFTVAITTAITLSCFFKAGTANGAISYSDGGGGSVGYGKFTLSGAGGAAINGGATSATITKLPNGWYYCTLTLTTGIANGFAAFGPWDGTADQFSYPGSNATTVYAWGAQAELGAFATSYIPTVASQVTRAADQISILTSAFPWSYSQGTAAIEMTPSQVGDTATRTALGIDSLGRLFYTNGTTVRSYDGTNIVLSLQSMSKDTLFKAAVSFGGSGLRLSTQGNAVVSGSFDGVMGAGSSLNIGHGVGSPFGGWIKRIAMYSTEKTAAELQVLST